MYVVLVNLDDNLKVLQAHLLNSNDNNAVTYYMMTYTPP